jgi:hypothetical protein
LAADFRTVPEFQNDLAGALVNQAAQHSRRQEFDAAVALLEEAEPHHRVALEAGSRNPAFRQSYRTHLLVLADCRLGQADHARLATTADKLAGFGYEPAADAYRAARLLCRCVRLAAEDTRLEAARRQELAQGYTDRALALLGQAVERGFKDVARLKQDPDLNPLRELEGFRKLLAELEGGAHD